MAIPASELRRVMGHFATGVAIITTRNAEGEPAGLTANALTSVSLDPPLVLVCVDKGADCYACFDESRRFAVNVLSEEQEGLSRKFATKGADKFEGVGYRVGEGGCALLDAAVAWLDCRIVQSHDAGDHTIHVAEVTGGDAAERPPLLFFRGGYRKLAGG
jgi:3-hydroxy-9,10-secoandrosta-1,3,5(10)-triene-9,17-dione monooxygenase reductase component